jgi:hypothetical protein
LQDLAIVCSDLLPLLVARWLGETSRETVKGIGAVRGGKAVGTCPNCSLRVGADLLSFIALRLGVTKWRSVVCLCLVFVVSALLLAVSPAYSIATPPLVLVAQNVGAAIFVPMAGFVLVRVSTTERVAITFACDVARKLFTFAARDLCCASHDSARC